MVDVTEYDRDNNDLHHEKICLYYQAPSYKAFFVLNSGEHEIYHALKCYNANNR